MNVYLDYAAAVPMLPETKEYLIDLLDTYGNPSSIHSVGEKANTIISNARISIANFINADADNIYFTCGGCASNTLAIKGYYTKHDCCILYSPIAHKSILKCVASYQYSYPLKVDKDGVIDILDLKEWLDSRNVNPFVIIDYANSEIGTIQNVKEITDLVHFYNGIVYLDCTGSISQIPLDVAYLNVDMAGFSAHKLGGLKGCGVLYKKSKLELEPLIYGSQEHGFIGGTENVLGIAALGKVVESYSYSSIRSKNRDYVLDFILKNIRGSYLIGSKNNRLPHNLFMCFKGVDGESLMLFLDIYGIQAATGSACNSKNIVASPALSAINMNKEDIYSCIRMTFSGKENKEELDYVCLTLKNCISELRNGADE